MTIRDVNYYLSLPYTIELVREDNATWFARVVELPGCMTKSRSAEDAVTMIRDAMTGWLELALADGRNIPEPKVQEAYSGKFVVRVPKSLHRDLVDAAAREQVSLNQFIATELARAVGRPSPPTSVKTAKFAPLPAAAAANMHEVKPSYQSRSTEMSDVP